MKLSTKLSCLIGAMIVGIIFIGVFAVYQMKLMNAKTTELSEVWLPATVSIQRINTLSSDFRIYEVQHIFSLSETVMLDYENKMAAVLKEIEPNIEVFRSLLISDEERNLYNNFIKNWDAYLASNKKLIELSRQNKNEEAETILRAESMDYFLTASDFLMQAVTYNVDGSNNAGKESNLQSSSAIRTITIAMAIIAIIAIVTSILIIRDTLRTLGKDPLELNHVAMRVIQGDYKIDDGSPKIGVYGNIVSMVATLEENINKAQQESDYAKEQSQKAMEAVGQAEIASKAAQDKTAAMLDAADRLENVATIVSSASTELSAQIEESERGASEQAARVTETATAMEEMNSTVLEVARNATAAAELANTTRQKAQAGAGVVQSAVLSIQQVQKQSLELKADMEVLNENSRAINQIMGVISDIADQTNLLALNAAIEAARAGDAGRGFAVVADEVRNLAEKTVISTTDVGNAIRAIQESTKKSMHQVDVSVKTIEEATSFANQSGTALAEIVDMVDKSADQVRAIATASEQQSATSEEINRSINQVNAIATETAKAMAEASQAVSDLANQSHVLSDLIADMQKG